MQADRPTSSSAGPGRWRFAPDTGLWLSRQASVWLALDPAAAAAQWKSTVLPKLAVSDRTRLVESLLRALDGEPLDVQTVTLDQGAAARMLRWIGVGSQDGRSLDGLLLDVSRDAHEREALLELSGLQRSFIDALPWPACAYDESGDVLLANRLWRRCADCTVDLEGSEVPLPDLPEWMCRERGNFHAGGTGERLLQATLRSSEGHEQPASIHRRAVRQGGTPLNLLSVESRAVPGLEAADQEDAGSTGR